uniref:alpha-2A adrenergic receptor-like n=1 Tax=Styela clava TaxID=7725 RepID=UPI001939D7AF|nr:alpha-2A adrenergic receptor-like [Styela clava]
MPVDTRNSCSTDLFLDVEEKNMRLLTMHTIVITLVGILIILILFGNWLVIVSILKFKRMRDVQNILILSLAVCDFLIGILILPQTLSYELLGYWPFGKIACKIYLLLDIALCTGSIWTLSMISINRYLAMKLVVRYRFFNKTKNGVVMDIIIWILSIVVCLPAVLYAVTGNDDELVCNHSEERWFILYSVSISFYIPMFLMCTMYVRVIWDFRTRLKSSTANQALLKKEKKLNTLVGLTMAAFVICWFPFFQVYLVRVICPTCCVPPTLMKFFEWFGYVNCALNPIIYSSNEKEFRNAFKLILRTKNRIEPSTRAMYEELQIPRDRTPEFVTRNENCTTIT